MLKFILEAILYTTPFLLLSIRRKQTMTPDNMFWVLFSGIILLFLVGLLIDID